MNVKKINNKFILFFISTLDLYKVNINDPKEYFLKRTMNKFKIEKITQKIDCRIFTILARQV